MSLRLADGTDRPGRAIALILVAVTAISLNDMIIKALSGAYPLHQMIFARSVVAITFSLTMLQIEGGWALLRTGRPVLHALRGLSIVIANTAFFAALAVLPLAEATTLYFAAPLFITLLAIPILGERVGAARLAAVAAGFLGVIVMQRPWAGAEALSAPRLVLLLPVLSGFGYALMQVLTRKLGATMRASAMAVHLQVVFLAVSGLMGLVAGDGRFADGIDDPSLQFLLRAWAWPEGQDWALFVALGLASGTIGYFLAAAYRGADAATLAPFEYTGLALAVLWGWLVFGTVPGPTTLLGMVLIAGAGLVIILRERRKRRELASRRPMRRL